MTAFPVQIECPTADVTPGEQLCCLLRIYNPADAVDDYTVVGLDEAAGWVSTDPPSLTLMPKTDGELQLRITIPTDAPVPAGTHRLLLQVNSSLNQAAAVIEDLSLQVAERTRAELAITPPADSSAAHDVTATLTAANHGNHPLELHFTAIDHDHDLALRVTPWDLVVQPFHAATLPLTLPFADCPADGSHVHRVEVTATADSRLAESAQATIPHEPSPPRADQEPAPRRSFGQWLRQTIGLFILVPIAVIVVVALEVLAALAVAAFLFSGPDAEEGMLLAAAVAAAATLIGAGLVAHHRGAMHALRAARADAAAVDERLANRAVWQMAGVLLLVPGFVTDLAGVVLVLPGIRHATRRKLSTPRESTPPSVRNG